MSFKSYKYQIIKFNKKVTVVHNLTGDGHFVPILNLEIDFFYNFDN